METNIKAVRVGGRFDHTSALNEACRRAQVMHSKWPETAWRFRVVRERHREVPRWHVWSIYCLIPQ